MYLFGFILIVSSQNSFPKLLKLASFPTPEVISYVSETVTYIFTVCIPSWNFSESWLNFCILCSIYAYCIVSLFVVLVLWVLTDMWSNVSTTTLPYRMVTPKNSLMRSIYSQSLPTPGNHWFVFFPIVLSLPECHINTLGNATASWIWLLPIRKSFKM